MNAIIADTHAVVWYLFAPDQLSTLADAALMAAVAGGGEVLISSISIIEVLYLVEKGRLAPATYDDLIFAVHDPMVPLDVLPLDLDITKAIQHIPRTIVPDLPDRIVAATALAYDLPLVTRDSMIRAAPIRTIW